MYIGNELTIKMVLNGIAPKSLTKKYNCNKACEDIVQINILLNKKVCTESTRNFKMHCRDLAFFI